MRPRAGPLVYAVALVPIVLWGTSFVAAKVALGSFTPLGLAWARGVLGLATLLAIAPLRRGGTDNPRPGDGRILVLLGLLGVVAQSLLQAVALTMTSATHSGWLITMIPLFTAVLSSLVLKERFPAPKVAGTALGFGGALAVIAAGSGAPSLRLPSTRGDLLILASALNWSVYTLAARGLLARRAALPVTLRSLAIGCAALTAVWAFAGGAGEFVAADRAAWAALLYLGIGCTGIGWLCWSFALERLEPGTLTSFQYLQPLVTSVSAAAWLGERVTVPTLIGGGLALAGVALVQRTAAPR